MATFEIKTKQPMNINGEYVDRGLSIQISTMLPNPFDNIEKIHNAFVRVHGLDFKSAGYLNPGHFELKKI